VLKRVFKNATKKPTPKTTNRTLFFSSVIKRYWDAAKLHPCTARKAYRGGNREHLNCLGGRLKWLSSHMPRKDRIGYRTRVLTTYQRPGKLIGGIPELWDAFLVYCSVKEPQKGKAKRG